MQESKPILLVEDDNIDAMTVERAVRDLKIEKHLVRVKNGEEALNYLSDDSNESPCLVLLDLNTPKMNGMEFLRIVKADEDLKTIPVVVLTTSDDQEEVAESFRLSAAGYMIKSIDYAEFMETIHVIDTYWTRSKTPRQSMDVAPRPCVVGRCDEVGSLSL